MALSNLTGQPWPGCSHVQMRFGKGTWKDRGRTVRTNRTRTVTPAKHLLPMLVHAEQVPHDRVPLPKARDREWVPDQCVIHKISGVARIVRCENFLKCGRLLSRNFDAVPVDFPEPRELDHCAQCSRSLV